MEYETRKIRRTDGGKGDTPRGSEEQFRKMRAGIDWGHSNKTVTELTEGEPSEKVLSPNEQRQD